MHTLPDHHSTNEYHEDWHLCAGISDPDNNSDTPEELHKDLEMLLAGEITSDEYIRKINHHFENRVD